MMLKVIIIAITIMAIGIAAEEFPADKPCTKEGAFDYYCHTCHCEKSGFGAACTKENCENKFNEDGTFTEEYEKLRKKLRAQREKKVVKQPENDEISEEEYQKEFEQPENVEIPGKEYQKKFEQPEKDSMLGLVKKGYKTVKNTAETVLGGVGHLWR